MQNNELPVSWVKLLGWLQRAPTDTAKGKTHSSERLIEEINHDDLLEFRRQLYSLGNESIAVFHHFGIV